MQLIKTEDHPAGGKFHWYESEGRLFSILDDDYPNADDFEILERDPERLEQPDRGVIQGSERRAPTMEAALAIIEQLTAPSPG